MGKTERRIAHGNDETTWTQRVADVLARFCNGLPPREMVAAWFDNDDDRLQFWVNQHLQPSAMWAQGIELIDAAERLANTPAETETRHGHRAGPHHPRIANGGA